MLMLALLNKFQMKPVLTNMMRESRERLQSERSKSNYLTREPSRAASLSLSKLKKKFNFNDYLCLGSLSGDLGLNPTLYSSSAFDSEVGMW